MITFSFGRALEELRSGRKVAREGWNGKGMHVMLQVPDANSKMQRPYIFIVPADPAFTVPWVASHADLLTDDWYIVD